MVDIEIQGAQIHVFKATKNIGYIQQYINPSHASNIYLEFHLESFEMDSQILFQKISKALNKKLQVMLYETEREVINFLIAGGFHLKRKCYEYYVQKKDLIQQTYDISSVEKIDFSNVEYENCAHFLYKKYKKNHRKISPLTESFEVFSKSLPDNIYIQRDKHRILHYAFVKENEIAYVGSHSRQSFKDFIQSVANLLFLKYEFIEFEVDDNDLESNILKNCFTLSDVISFNTYIK